MQISRDVNGNKLVNVLSSDLTTWYLTKPRGFSIKTLYNLPLTNAEGVTFTTENEIFHHISQFGTIKQKSLIGCCQDLTLRDFITRTTYGGSKLFKTLSEDDIEQLVKLIGGRKMKRVRSLLTYDLKSIDFCGVDNRFTYDYKSNKWGYISGQDYKSEMALIRKRLL